MTTNKMQQRVIILPLALYAYAALVAGIFCLQFCAASAVGDDFYTEGGNYRNQQQQRTLNDFYNYLPEQQQQIRYYVPEEKPQDIERDQQQELYQYQQEQAQYDAAQKERYLQNIVEQLRNRRNTRYQNTAQPIGVAVAPVAFDYGNGGGAAQSDQPPNEDETLAELEELHRFTEKIRQLERGSSSANALPESNESQSRRATAEAASAAAAPVARNNANHAAYSPLPEVDTRPLSAQKKGQSEFVEFVEPRANKILNGIEFMEKRVAMDAPVRAFAHTRGFLSANGNVVFLAFVAMCCVVATMGVVGGIYYYYHNIKSTREDLFDDFTRYSPAGPGRDRFKKGSGGSPLGAGGCVDEKGDDVLAYKAQLHHYQQTKQKIIGGADAVGGGVRAPGDLTDRSDDEEDDDGADLEHNFSVYECPGLAPTGDIEVQNPNFVEVSHK